MMFRMATLKRIEQGEISVAFRRWRRPTVKTGGSKKTAIGVVAIELVEKITDADITDNDLRRAGYDRRETLFDDLDGRNGDLYRITLSYAGEDPRIALREDDALSDEEFAEIKTRLDRLDNASKVGIWTRQVLELVSDNPELVSGELAKKSSWEKPWLKLNIRKLKNLGLTISLEVGYRISPRGTEVLRRLRIPSPGR